ncbi:MAG: TonB-dependent receptor domain-containing protein [Terriglobia bacterium]
MAQIGGNGVIQGTLTDPTGAVIPGAAVIATNEATGVKTTSQTTGKGFYVLSPLPAGEYTVRATAAGFKVYSQEHVVVNAISTVGLNLTLQVGAATQQVTVTAAPPQLNTSNGTLGATVPNSAYAVLPLAVSGGPRDPQGFVTLLPGVTGAGGTLHVNGGQGYSGTIYVNGSPDMYQELGNDNRGLALGLSVDSIQQFQIDTSGTPAMYDGQGVENYVIKSGGNQFHGSAFEFARNTAFDSRSFFAATRPVEIQHEFGGTLGGPIKRNKIFFFADYDGWRLHAGTNPSFRSIPTSGERTGDFSALLGPQMSTCGSNKKSSCTDALGRPIYQGEIFNPATTRTLKGVEVRDGFGFDPTTGLPIPGQANVIPTADISKISQSLQSYLPAAVSSSVQNNFSASFPQVQSNNEITTREDFVLSDKDRMWTAFDWGKKTYIQGPNNGLPLPYAEERQVVEEPWLGQWGDTYTLTPTLLNQLNLSYNRIGIPISNLTVGQHYPTKAGISGLPSGQAANAFPRINWSGPNSPTNWGGNAAEAFDEFDNEWDITENMEWVHGTHDVKFGADLAKQSDIFFSPDQGSFPAVFSFSNSETAGFDQSGNLLTAVGNSYASYLLGDLADAGISYDAAAEVDSLSYRTGLFVEDDWKTTQRLTLNLGLRWDVFTPFVERFNHFTFMNPALPNPAVNNYAGVLQYAGFGQFSCKCRTPVQTHYGDFAPRFGFAYRLMKHTVLRGSWGMFYDRAGALGGGIDTQAANLGALGYSNGPIITSPDGFTPAQVAWNGGAMPSFVQPPVFDPTLNTGYNTTTGPKGGGMTFPDPQLGGHPVVTESYNFGVERELTPSTVLTVSYSGSQGHFIPGGVGRGIYTDQIQPKYLVLGRLLTQSATTANLASANSILAANSITSVGLPYPTFDGTIGQMLRPFPQYSGVSDPYGDVGNEVYNSLQVMAQRRMSRGLYFLASYTFSKDIGTGGSVKGGKGAGLNAARSGYNGSIEKAVCPCDIPNNLTISEVWQLPLGAGHSLFSGSPVARALASGWEFSGIETYSSGTPLGPVGAACNVPYAGRCYADYNPSFNGSARINGSYGNGVPQSTPYIDKGAFESPAPYTYGNTPRTLPFDLRGPAGLNEDFALMRNFKLHENWTFQLRAEAFNAFNRVIFGGPNFNITSSAFGTIGSAGDPRIVQFSGRIVF